MRDIDIRNILLHTLRQKYGGDSNTLVIEEMGLCQGNARVDVAVVNGSIHGYEIKSEKDTLKRLSGQQDIYNKVLDYVTVVTCTRHLYKIKQSVPRWWGISEVQCINGQIKLVKIRPCKKNKKVNPNELVQLLWRNETLDILRERNFHRGLINRSRNILWNSLVQNISIRELKKEIRDRIKTRQNWRVVSQ
ncbi:MAG: sce7726 family protein [Thermodesulfovibrionales bacterium]|nr:sce7726 family protein [Thermodesulfovibrionales bacterium]